MTTNIVERVVEAFKTHDLLAIQEEWGVECAGDGTYKAESNKCCCGLGALLIGLSCVNPKTGSHFDQDEAAAYYLKVSRSYVDGFVNGFDGASSMADESSDKSGYNDGYRDGDESWKILERLSMVATMDDVIFVGE